MSKRKPKVSTSILKRYNPISTLKDCMCHLRFLWQCLPIPYLTALIKFRKAFSISILTYSKVEARRQSINLEEQQYF